MSRLGPRPTWNRSCEVEGCPHPPSTLSGICIPHETHAKTCHWPEGGTCSCTGPVAIEGVPK